jgi:hypothetical protein
LVSRRAIIGGGAGFVKGRAPCGTESNYQSFSKMSLLGGAFEAIRIFGEK